MNAGPLILLAVLCVNPLACLGLGYALGRYVAKHGWKLTIERTRSNVARVLRPNS